MPHGRVFRQTGRDGRRRLRALFLTLRRGGGW